MLPKTARLGPPFFDPQNPPQKFTWAPFLAFPGNEAHQLFFLGGGGGGPKMGFWAGAIKFMLKNLYVIFFLLLLLLRVQGVAELAVSCGIRKVGAPKQEFQKKGQPCIKTSSGIFP